MATARVRCAQFLHNVFDVHLHGLFGDEELFGDVSVPVAACNLPVIALWND